MHDSKDEETCLSVAIWVEDTMTANVVVREGKKKSLLSLMYFRASLRTRFLQGIHIFPKKNEISVEKLTGPKIKLTIQYKTKNSDLLADSICIIRTEHM